MKVIGVELHTPKRDELVVLTILSLVYIVVAYLTAVIWSISGTTLAPFLVGAVSGSLAASCGCSILKHGVRGAILTAGFCIAMIGLCAAIIYTSKMF